MAAMPPRRRIVSDPEVVDVLTPGQATVFQLALDEDDIEQRAFDDEVDEVPQTLSAVTTGAAVVMVSAQTQDRPDVPLTAEQLRIKELENLLALERGKKDPTPDLEVAPVSGEHIIVHFLEDGFTALGQVWYRGQELEFAAGSPAYRDTCDRTGRSWLELRRDDFAQVEKFGAVVFRDGPWRGKSYLDAATAPFEPLKSLKGEGSVPAPSEDELARAADAERRRRRAAPRLPAM